MNKPSSTGGMEAYDRLEKVCRTLLDFKHPVAVPWIFNIRWQLFVVQPLSRASVLRTTLDSDSRVWSNLYSLSIFKILGYPFLVWSCYQTYILTVYRKSTKVPLRSQSLFFKWRKDLRYDEISKSQRSEIITIIDFLVNSNFSKRSM